jgi:hypothetical protein
MQFDEKNGNTKWQDAIALELKQINKYETFTDVGHHTKAKVHFNFDVKHDGHHKAWLVADGHLTEVPLESVYSGVVHFLAELNKLELWVTDIGNAYLEAFTSELVYIIFGPDFKELKGHFLLISKELYGLYSRCTRWHARFADCISELGFFPCNAEPDI